MPTLGFIGCLLSDELFGDLQSEKRTDRQTKTRKIELRYFTGVNNTIRQCVGFGITSVHELEQ